MGLPRLYWNSRLNEGRALYGFGTRDVDYRRGWPWPVWVSRKALWEDFLLWAEGYQCPGYEGRAKDFFAELKPYLYPPGRKATASSFPVTVSRHRQGQWLSVVVRRKFIQLMELEDARDLFRFRRRQELDKG